MPTKSNKEMKPRSTRRAYASNSIRSSSPGLYDPAFALRALQPLFYSQP
jgi:hypothetical protein